VTSTTIVEVSVGTSAKKVSPIGVTPTSSALFCHVCTCPLTEKVNVTSSEPPRNPSSIDVTSMLWKVTSTDALHGSI
jgi:hypothetical protein